jgi:hypothetical protein
MPQMVFNATNGSALQRPLKYMIDFNNKTIRTNNTEEDLRDKTQNALDS